MKKISVESKVIVALDFQSKENLFIWLENLSPDQCRVKVGKELFTRYGPSLVETLQKKGFEVFLDLKFHDIPNTVAQACKSAADLGVWMLNVHAMGGRRMLEAAREALASYQHPPLLVGVSLLTSIQQSDLVDIGIEFSTSEYAFLLAKLCFESGLNGVVCSGLESSLFKKTWGQNFLTILPGIRFPEDSKDDQSRVVTPAAAFAAGADFLVIGRTLTHAKDPKAVFERICTELKDAFPK